MRVCLECLQRDEAEIATQAFQFSQREHVGHDEHLVFLFRFVQSEPLNFGHHGVRHPHRSVFCHLNGDVVAPVCCFDAQDSGGDSPVVVAGGVNVIPAGLWDGFESVVVDVGGFRSVPVLPEDFFDDDLVAFVFVVKEVFISGDCVEGVPDATVPVGLWFVLKCGHGTQFTPFCACFNKLFGLTSTVVGWGHDEIES